MVADKHFKDMWLQWARSSLNGLGTFLEFGVPSAVIESSMWISMELLVLLSGYGYINQGTHVLTQSEKNSNHEISLDFAAMVFMINMFGIIQAVPVGFSYVCSAIIGSLQADNKSQLAKKYSKICYFTSQAFITVICVVIFWKKKQLVGHFITNKDVTAIIMNLFPFAFGFFFLQSSFIILMGVFKGLG